MTDMPGTKIDEFTSISVTPVPDERALRKLELQTWYDRNKQTQEEMLTLDVEKILAYAAKRDAWVDAQMGNYSIPSARL